MIFDLIFLTISRKFWYFCYYSYQISVSQQSEAYKRLFIIIALDEKDISITG